jgi:hypothetical protein
VGCLQSSRHVREETVCDVLEQLADLRCYTLGPEHPDTLKTKSRLAINLWENSWWSDGVCFEPSRVEAMLQDVLQAQERVLGPAHPDTHVTRVYLGSSYTDQGMFEEAREVLRKAVHLSTEAFGVEHRDTKWACEVLRQCDEREEAEQEEEGEGKEEEDMEEEQEEVSSAGGTGTLRC